mmetsp:Transcript_106078/g.228538  ORF Transcript_106078/g.228538 Transcript_106078/m.228538 type:complete len:264 (+) Transcript_106078:724-1515(+)|eukprot:CAMPEP_0116929396 /NCGR_PEP_ID=MMETSP0467-20121206/26554_1 /TAXON_ID=283647 /ORGANISM="Mesodinium pulex, Strain SPMC105" /LENGTH=263 /DNA_ID=CAMNT_0004609353 /DNA_START=1388 /DNA_END=2179 /DNA_ORIENTATION=+
MFQLALFSLVIVFAFAQPSFKIAFSISTRFFALYFIAVGSLEAIFTLTDIVRQTLSSLHAVRCAARVCTVLALPIGSALTHSIEACAPVVAVIRTIGFAAVFAFPAELARTMWIGYVGGAIAMEAAKVGTLFHATVAACESRLAGTRAFYTFASGVAVTRTLEPLTILAIKVYFAAAIASWQAFTIFLAVLWTFWSAAVFSLPEIVTGASAIGHAVSVPTTFIFAGFFAAVKSLVGVVTQAHRIQFVGLVAHSVPAAIVYAVL